MINDIKEILVLSNKYFSLFEIPTNCQLFCIALYSVTDKLNRGLFDDSPDITFYVILQRHVYTQDVSVERV